MQGPFKKFSIRLCKKGLTKNTFMWPDYRDFTEAFVKALTSMHNGPSADQIRPEGIRDGSAAVDYSIPREFFAAIRRVGKGPKSDWSDEERHGVIEMHDWCEKKSVRAFVSYPGQKEIEVVIPKKENIPDAISYDTIEGVVWWAGGDNGNVHIKTDFHDAQMIFQNDFSIASELGKKLYHKVRLSCRIQRDGVTKTIKKAEILEVVDDLGPYENWKDNVVIGRQFDAIMRIRKVFEREMPDFDFEEHLREMRDE